MLPSPPSSTLFPYTTLFRSHRVRFVAIDSVLAHSFENLLLLDFTVFGQGCQRGYRHVVTIHFEEAAQLRSEEHTSELQSRPHLVCRLLLEKKKRKRKQTTLH